MLRWLLRGFPSVEAGVLGAESENYPRPPPIFLYGIQKERGERFQSDRLSRHTSAAEDLNIEV